MGIGCAGGVHHGRLGSIGIQTLDRAGTAVAGRPGGALVDALPGRPGDLECALAAHEALGGACRPALWPCVDGGKGRRGIRAAGCQGKRRDRGGKRKEAHLHGASFPRDPCDRHTDG